VGVLPVLERRFAHRGVRERGQRGGGQQAVDGGGQHRVPGGRPGRLPGVVEDAVPEPGRAPRHRPVAGEPDRFAGRRGHQRRVDDRGHQVGPVDHRAVALVRLRHQIEVVADVVVGAPDGPAGGGAAQDATDRHRAERGAVRLEPHREPDPVQLGAAQLVPVDAGVVAGAGRGEAGTPVQPAQHVLGGREVGGLEDLH
jgi:hypothetical protein